MKDNRQGADLSTANNKLPLIIGNENFEWNEQYILGGQVKNLVKAADDVQLFLAIEKPWEDELIEDDEKVDLARPGIERFFFKPVLLLTINGKIYKWYEQFITGKQLKEIAKIPLDDELFLSIKKPWEDELIGNETSVDLARPGIEHFFSKETPVDFTIVVNATPKNWKEKTISFEQVVVLAFGVINNRPETGYTVTYSRGVEPKPEGTMVKGSIVVVKNKMIFDVTATDKS